MKRPDHDRVRRSGRALGPECRRSSRPALRIVLAAGTAFVLASMATSVPSADGGAIEILPGNTAGGEATALWKELLRKKIPADKFDRVEGLVKPLTEAEHQWEDLIRRKVREWEELEREVGLSFPGVEHPAAVRIVLGNRGAEDAFTHDPRTIGFDLERLVDLYGDAGEPENDLRIDRLFRHEYSHLLQKAWMPGHPYETNSPQRAALLGIWLEGLSHNHSLSDRWRFRNGSPSEDAAGALARLEPRFVARMAALACAGEEAARNLTADLSYGRFDRKWGALTVALWLEEETAASPDALRRFVLAGPDGVWDLAGRHLDQPLRDALAEAREAASLCTRN